MKSNKRTLFTRDLQSLVDLRSSLSSEIEELQSKLTQIKRVKNYTDLTRERMVRLSEEIRRKKHNLAQLSFMQSLTNDVWVKNGSPKPGKVVNLGITEDGSPAVEVNWVNSDRTIVTIPTQLKIVRDEELVYHWKGTFPKLTRKLEPTECEDVEMLTQFKESEIESLKRAKAVGQPKKAREVYENRIKYCTQRIGLLTAKPSVQVSLDLEQHDEASVDTHHRRVEQEKILSRLYGSPKSDPILRDISIDRIICDPRCQQREQLDGETLADYTQTWLSGGKLPAVKIMQQGDDYWLYDGFHTLQSAKDARITTIEAEVTEGTLRDAILASVGVNANHGLRRSNQTKRNAVMTLLKDEEWRKWSNVEIAKKCKVSESLVRSIRKKHPELQNNEIIRRDKHGNISKMSIEQIGSSTNGHFVLNEVRKNEDSTNDNIVLNDDNKRTISTNDNIVLNEVRKNEDSTNGHFVLNEVRKNQRNVSMMLKVGQIVQIENSDRIDERLIGYKNSYASITAKYEHSVNLKIWGHEIKNVAINDIKLAPIKVPITVNLYHEKLTEIMDDFESLEDYIDWKLRHEGFIK